MQSSEQINPPRRRLPAPTSVKTLSTVVCSVWVDLYCYTADARVRETKKTMRSPMIWFLPWACHVHVTKKAFNGKQSVATGVHCHTDRLFSPLN